MFQVNLSYLENLVLITVKNYKFAEFELCVMRQMFGCWHPWGEHDLSSYLVLSSVASLVWHCCELWVFTDNIVLILTLSIHTNNQSWASCFCCWEQVPIMWKIFEMWKCMNSHKKLTYYFYALFCCVIFSRTKNSQCSFFLILILMLVLGGYLLKQVCTLGNVNNN